MRQQTPSQLTSKPHTHTYRHATTRGPILRWIAARHILHKTAIHAVGVRDSYAMNTYTIVLSGTLSLFRTAARCQQTKYCPGKRTIITRHLATEICRTNTDFERWHTDNWVVLMCSLQPCTCRTLVNELVRRCTYIMCIQHISSSVEADEGGKLFSMEQGSRDLTCVSGKVIRTSVTAYCIHVGS